MGQNRLRYLTDGSSLDDAKGCIASCALKILRNCRKRLTYEARKAGGHGYIITACRPTIPGTGTTKGLPRRRDRQFRMEYVRKTTSNKGIEGSDESEDSSKKDDDSNDEEDSDDESQDKRERAPSTAHVGRRGEESVLNRSHSGILKKVGGRKEKSEREVRTNCGMGKLKTRRSDILTFKFAIALLHDATRWNWKDR